MKSRVTTAFVLLTFFGLGGTITHAQSEKIKSAREAVIETLSQIQSLKDDILLPTPEKIFKEQTLKRTAFGNILILSLIETEEMHDKLQGIVLEDSNAPLEPLREDLIERLERHIKYLNALQDLLETTETYDAVQNLIDQFEAKRKEAHNPDVKRAAELLLTLQVDSAIDRGYERLDKLTTLVKKAKATKTELAARLSLISLASAHLAEAKHSALLAHEELAKYLAPKTPAIEQAITEVLPPKSIVFSIQDFNEQAITSTKDAYKNFLELSDGLAKKK